MISKHQQTMNGHEAMSHISADKALSLDMKTDCRGTGECEAESDSLCENFHLPPKRKLSLGKLQVSFEKITTYPYDVPEPAQKRRRFQRRNSKTAQMLSMSMLPVLALDLAGKEEITTSCPEYDEDINIAEDLVRHFQASRKRAQPVGQIIKS